MGLKHAPKHGTQAKWDSNIGLKHGLKQDSNMGLKHGLKLNGTQDKWDSNMGFKHGLKHGTQTCTQTWDSS